MFSKYYSATRLKMMEDYELERIINSDQSEDVIELCKKELERREILKRMKYLLDVRFDYARRASIATKPEVKAEMELKFHEVSKELDRWNKKLEELVERG